MKTNNTMLSLFCLVKRNIKLYMKNKMTVFFSVLAPVIVLLLYILFLGDLQVNNILGILQDEGVTEIAGKDIRSLIDSWMISGVMAVSCITVTVNASTTMVRDRAQGNVNDVLSSPVKRWVLYLSYIISCFIITFSICFIVFVISSCYLAGVGAFHMSFLDVICVLAIMILSILSSSFFTTLFCSFIKTQSTLAAVNGVFSTAIGFLIGAYLPFSMLPKVIQYIACFIPGAYSAGLFRNYFLRGTVNYLIGIAPDKVDVINKIISQYSVELEFFGHEVSAGVAVLVIAASILLFGAIIWILYANKKTNFFNNGRKVKKQKFSVKKVKVTAVQVQITEENSVVQEVVNDKEDTK